MGGNVAFTIRKNGQEYRMDRWTNIMPYLLHLPDLLDGTQKGLDEALKSWLTMKNDWDKNGPDGPFEHNMTSVYAPYPYGLKPSEYGAIVMDFDTHTLLSLQGYCQVGAVGWTRMEYGPRADDFDPDRTEDIKTLHKAGRISSFNAYVPDETKIAPLLALKGATLIPSHTPRYKTLVIPGNTPIPDLLHACDETYTAKPQNSMNSPLRFGKVVVDMAPFTVEEFPETGEGYLSMLQRVKELGFSLCEEEEKGWLESANDL